MLIRSRLLFSLVGLSLVIATLIGERIGYSAAYTSATATQAAAAKAGAAILLADERLTMSAMTAATTGDTKWTDRYNSFVPDIDAAIGAAVALAPKDVADQFDHETKAANDQLVSMESDAMAAAAEGKLDEAQAILQGSDYASQKQTLAAGMDHFLSALAGQTTAQVDGVTSLGNMLITALSLFAVAVIAFAAFTVLRGVTRPLRRMESVMTRLAAGELDVEIPYGGRKDEIGHMAASVEAFQRNAVAVENMTREQQEGSAQRAADRKRMMQDLRSAFGDVVDASVAGDLSHRVSTNFSDDELNQLAKGVNTLVETVEHGVAGVGAVLAALAATDLTQRMVGEHRGAFAKLQHDTNTVADNLAEVVGRLRHTSGSVKSATGEILSGANDLSKRTTQQAAAIEETSAAVEQLASAVNENAVRAQSASGAAQSVLEIAAQAGSAMVLSNEAMDRISSSSGKISNIIGLIDDIAFQTNLLALNASVEAARAGDAGKGFAVVAVEVRRLAQSAAGASTEVKALVQQSAAEVVTGSRLAADAALKLTSMIDSVRNSATLIASIAEASQQQSSAINDITNAVREMDSVTQHNAALVEQTNAAIEQTEAQASELDRIVDGFVVDSPRNAVGTTATRPRLRTGDVDSYGLRRTA